MRILRGIFQSKPDLGGRQRYPGLSIRAEQSLCNAGRTMNLGETRFSLGHLASLVTWCPTWCVESQVTFYYSFYYYLYIYIYIIYIIELHILFSWKRKKETDTLLPTFKWKKDFIANKTKTPNRDNLSFLKLVEGRDLIKLEMLSVIFNFPLP